MDWMKISASWTYGFSKTKVQLYTGMTMSISFMSEAANLLEHISSFLVYDIHSQSECRPVVSVS
jgi:hypothetical protein